MLSYGNKTFTTKEELHTFMRDNKDVLFTQKREQLKQCDSISFDLPVIHSKDGVNKSLYSVNKAETSEDEIIIKAVINTTNIIDSHGDLHADGIWTKTTEENKRVLLLQEHKNVFDNIIAYPKDVKASVLNTTFKELGYDLEGSTQALVFDAKVKKSVNAKMYDRYKNGDITEHSVGMRYVKLELAINSESEYDKEEKAVWDEYSPVVANKEALESGYFWVVKEAKVIEGSAVPMGSNPFTPTITEPQKSTQETEPSFDTQKAIDIINNFTSKN